jgi:hypothetical protein
MWRHAKVYNAIIHRSLDRLDMTAGEVSWHLIWLHHEGLIDFDDHGRPVRNRQLRRAA